MSPCTSLLSYESLCGLSQTASGSRIFREVSVALSVQTSEDGNYDQHVMSTQISFCGPILLTLLFFRFIIFLVDKMSAKNEKRPFRKKTGPQKTQRPVHKKRKSTAIFPRPQAPEGYVFVPKGDVYITRRCTTLTQEAGQVVHIVYVSVPTGHDTTGGRLSIS